MYNLVIISTIIMYFVRSPGFVQGRSNGRSRRIAIHSICLAVRGGYDGGVSQNHTDTGLSGKQASSFVLVGKIISETGGVLGHCPEEKGSCGLNNGHYVWSNVQGVLVSRGSSELISTPFQHTSIKYQYNNYQLPYINSRILLATFIVFLAYLTTIVYYLPLVVVLKRLYRYFIAYYRIATLLANTTFKSVPLIVIAIRFLGFFRRLTYYYRILILRYY